MDRRYAFILGTGRCGSTIVMQAVSLHPAVGFVSNIEDSLARLDLRGRGNNRIYRALPSGMQRRGGRRGGAVLARVPKVGVTPSEGYRLLARQVSPMLSESCRDLTVADASPWIVNRLRAFFDARAEAQHSELFVHKFTGWPRAGLLHAAFPDARFVHVVRDGRAVAASLVQQPWWDGFAGPSGWRFGPLGPDEEAAWQRSGQSFTVLAGLEWKRLMQAFAAARAALPEPSWLELRYEDILDDPEGTLGAVAGHLGLAGEQWRQTVASMGWSNDRRDSYRRELPAGEVELLGRLLQPELQAHGYD